MFKDGNVKNRRPMPMGNPADFDLGSAGSRAAARAMVDAIRKNRTLVIIHNVPRPQYEGSPEPERAENGSQILRVMEPED